jgi:murein DD-endopeptidase MepM/ murein hydrolase activator NlpD
MQNAPFFFSFLKKVLALLLVLSLPSYTADAATADWATPWRSGNMIVTTVPWDAGHASEGKMAIDFAPAVKGNTVILYPPTTIAKITKISNEVNGYGNYIKFLTIDNENVVYAHLESIDPSIREGMTNIGPNQPLGIMGSTGRSTGTHLHYGMLNYAKTANITLFGLPISAFYLNAVIAPKLPSSSQPTPGPTPPTQPGSSVILHENNGGGGKSTPLSTALPLLIADLDSLGCGTDISSISVPDGVNVRVFREKNFDGHNMYYGSGRHDLPSDLSDNFFKSIKIWPVGTPEPPNPGQNPNPPSDPSPQGLVEFYNASAGRTSGKDPGEWNYSRGVGNSKNPSELGFPDNELSSLRINDDNVTVEVFPDADYHGEPRKFSGKGFYNLSQGALDFDNRVSSYKVYYTNQGPIDDSPTTPTPTAYYEVRNLHVDASGNLNITLVNTQTGQQTAPRWVKGSEQNCFLVKFPDGTTTFYIDEAWNITALHTDPYFAIGDGRFNTHGVYEFLPGQSVTFLTNSSQYDATVWVKPLLDTTPPPIPPIPPSDPDPDPDPGHDNDGGSTIIIPEIPDKIDVDVSGGGCNSAAFGGWVAALAIAAFLDRKLAKKNHRQQ